MKNTLAAIGLIVFIIYLCSWKLPPEVECISNPELLAHKKAGLTSTVEKTERAEIGNTEITQTSHKHPAMETKHPNHGIERLKAEHRDEYEESLSDNKRGLALARATERSIRPNQEPQLSHKARISRLPEIDINSIRRSHGYPEGAFQEISNAEFDETTYGKAAPSNYGEFAHSAAAPSDTHEIEEEARVTAMNEPNEEGTPADEPTSPTMVHQTEVIAGKAEGPAMGSNPEELSEILDEREHEDMLTLTGHSQSNLDAAAVPEIYGGEVNSAWFELQAHYQVPYTGAATSLSDSRDEPMQEVISEPANAGNYLTPAQAKEYNRASAEANNTRNPFDSDDDSDGEAEDEACDNLSQAGDEEVQNGSQEDRTWPAFLPQRASTLVVDPAMTAASAVLTAPEQTVIQLSPEQLEEYNQVSSAAFITRNPFDSDDEDDEPLPSSVGSTAENISTESKFTPAQAPSMAVHTPQMAPAPAPAPAPAAPPVHLKMVFPETDALPQHPTAPSAAPIHTWHNLAPASIAAVAASLPLHDPSFNNNAPTPLTTYSPPNDFSSMIWELSNPTPMDWDTATSIHLSNPPCRIITVGGFDIEAGTLREFREMRGATRLTKKGRQQQVMLDCRVGLGEKKGLTTAVGRGEGRRKGVLKSGREKRQGGEERRRAEKAEDCLMTFL